MINKTAYIVLCFFALLEGVERCSSSVMGSLLDNYFGLKAVNIPSFTAHFSSESVLNGRPF